MSKPVPIYRVPIRVRIFRCIRTGESFNALNSKYCTALRWEGNFWILTCRIYRTGDDGLTDHVDIDYAVGHKGERPFIIRPPYRDDPRKKFLWQMEYTYIPTFQKKGVKKVEVGIFDDLYAMFVDQLIVKRLDSLGCISWMKKIGVDEYINKETGRKNHVRKNVYHLEVHDCAEGSDLNVDSTIPRHAKDYWQWTDKNGNPCDSTVHWADGGRFRRNPKYKFRTVPMIEFGWYFTTNGRLAFKSTAPTFTPDEFLKTL